METQLHIRELSPGRAALAFSVILALGASAPGAAQAHAAERMVILTLPTGWYMTGAAAAVALTALLLLLAPRLPTVSPRRLLQTRSTRARDVTGAASALALLVLVAVGFWGSRDPYGNLLPLTVWTLIWVGLTLAIALFGDLWRYINPWRMPVRLCRRALGRDGSVGLSRAGYLPAIAGYFGFAWFEIVSLAPADPEVLAKAIVTYWLVVFLLAVLEGEEWLEQGEALTVFYGFVARISPLWVERGSRRSSLMLGPPGSQILSMPPLPPGACAFLALVLAAVTFDGLSETFWWLALIGVNPLEFPGRSGVMTANTIGLLAAWALTAGAILGAIALGRALAASRAGFWREAGLHLLGFLPIAAGYHIAHYLTSLLTGGQYAIEALSDPFDRGWNLFGLPEHWVSLAFLTDYHTVLAIWNVQFAAILGAHVLAVILNFALSARSAGRPGLAAHLPMTLLMVLYTILGLWLLSAATGA